MSSCWVGSAGEISHRQEQSRRGDHFSRKLTLNVPVDANKVEATFDSGVLTVTLPKAEAARPKTIKVEAKN
jgi:HSP20 family protein